MLSSSFSAEGEVGMGDCSLLIWFNLLIHSSILFCFFFYLDFNDEELTRKTLTARTLYFCYIVKLISLHKFLLCKVKNVISSWAK